MKGGIEIYRSVRDEFFQEPYPPNTLLIVESLALPDFIPLSIIMFRIAELGYKWL